MTGTMAEEPRETAGYVFPEAWFDWYCSAYERVKAADPHADVLEPAHARPLAAWWARTHGGEPPRPRVKSGDHYYLDRIAAAWAGVRLVDARALVRSYPIGALPDAPHPSTRRALDGSKPIRRAKPQVAMRRAAEHAIAGAIAAPTDRGATAAAVVAVLELADELGINLRRPDRGGVGLEGALAKAVAVSIRTHRNGHRRWRNGREQERCERRWPDGRRCDSLGKCRVLKRPQPQKDRTDCVLEQLLGFHPGALRKT